MRLALVLCVGVLAGCDSADLTTANASEIPVRIQQPEWFNLGSDFVCVSKGYAQTNLPELFVMGWRFGIDKELVIMP